MGKRGPTKQPEAVARLKGTLRKVRYEDTINGGGLRFVNEIPEPPEHYQEKTKAFWYSQLNEMIRVGGWIAKTDLVTFELACSEYDIIVEAEQHEKYYTTSGGIEKLSAPWYLRAKAIPNFLKLIKEFGWSPSARASVKLEQDTATAEDITEFQL